MRYTISNNDKETITLIVNKLYIYPFFAVILLLPFFNPNADTIIFPLCDAGAAFDYISEFKKHAPRWIRENGFEWLFRLLQEPKRLWRRYLILNVKFIIEIIKMHT